MKTYRIVFMGTAAFSATCLQALIDHADFQVVLTISQPDKPQGRKKEVIKTPVHALSEQYGIKCLQPDHAKGDDLYLAIQDADPDFIVTAAYGHLLPERVLNIANHYSVNVHASLLPKYRGASPVQWSLMNGDHETGITIMKMVSKMDAGGIFRQERLLIDPNEDSEQLMARLAILGAHILPETLLQIAQESLKPEPQSEEQATAVGMLTKDQGIIDWSKDSQTIHNLVRGVTPWPGAQTTLNGKPVKILKTKVCSDLDDGASSFKDATLSENSCQDSYLCELKPGQLVSTDLKRILVRCGDVDQPSLLEIISLQFAGKKAMEAKDCAHNFSSDMIFGVH